jgi:outer membrane protein assembly factor BamB
VLVGSYNGVFYCLSARTGRALWEVGTGGSISGAAVVVNGVAYAGSFGHRIVGVAVRTGRVLVRFPHGEYVPVSGSGVRLLLHGYSRIYAVESRALWLRRHRPAGHHRRR